MAKEEKKLYCEKCRKMLKENNFYSSNNLKKYPNGKLNECKNCITMHVDNWEPDTYKWILEECDVPYIPEVWDSLLLKYGKDEAEMTGTTILGRYLSKMKLNQNRKYRWKDTEYIAKIKEKEMREALEEQGYSEAEIQEKISESGKPKVVRVVEKVEVPVSNPTDDFFPAPAGRPSRNQSAVENDLTEDDIKYLSIKWGRQYSPEEWVKLEKLYTDMKQSYEIQGAGHEDTLKLICKTSLKANQLIDINDIEGFQKISKVYDSLMKSGNFTAAQNKVQDDNYINSISELVAICETEGFIPRFYQEVPNDRVDETIQDLKEYTRSLVMDEMNLGTLIEDAVKTIGLQQLDEMEQAKEEEEMAELTYDELSKLKDEDYGDFMDFLEEESELDNEVLLGEENNKLNEDEDLWR